MNMAAHYAASERLSHEQMVEKHAPLVKRVAYHLMGRMPASVQVDDLIQAGMVGLLEAINNYDGTKGASFETYARIRIQGAMIDEVRRGDWTPRSVYRKARMLAEAVRTVENREGREARPEEVARELDMSLDQYNSILRDTSGCHVLSFDEINGDEWNHEPEHEQGRSGPLPELQKHRFNGEPGRGHCRPAGAGAAGHVALLRRRIQPARDRRGAGRERGARVPDPRPGADPAARAHARLDIRRLVLCIK